MYTWAVARSFTSVFNKVVWEMSDRCLAWRLPLFQQLPKKYELFDAVAKGCAVNFRDKPQGKFLQKGWRLLTTHTRLARATELPCRCPKHYVHARCEGSLMNSSGLYTPEFARRVARHIQQEAQGQTKLPEAFRVGLTCVCSELQICRLAAQS